MLHADHCIYMKHPSHIIYLFFYNLLNEKRRTAYELMLLMNHHEIEILDYPIKIHFILQEKSNLIFLISFFFVFALKHFQFIQCYFIIILHVYSSPQNNEILIKTYKLLPKFSFFIEYSIPIHTVAA